MNGLNANCNSKEGISIPRWMLEKDVVTVRPQGRGGTGFLRKTLAGISEVMLNDVFLGRFAGNGMFLQRVDARVKLVTLLLFMIICGLARGAPTFAFLAMVAIMYAALSGLSLKDYVKRVWLVIPLLVFLFSLPASTGLFIGGKPLFYISGGLYVTAEGLRAIAVMSLRIGLSLSFAYLLIMTTRWGHLTKALAVLRVPPLLIAVLDMAYRHIFTLSRLAGEMLEARFLRTVGKISNRENRGFIAGRIAFLFIKSGFLCDEVYDSMRCRCYTGEHVSIDALKLTASDVIFIFCNVVIILILIMGEMLL